MSFADALLTAAEEYRREMGERDGLQARVRTLEDALRVAEEALWMWDYNPPTFSVGHGHGTKEASRGFFCAGCDMDGDEHLRPLDGRHDGDCKAARRALQAIRKALGTPDLEPPGVTAGIDTSPPPRGAQEGGTCFHAYTMFEPSLDLYRCISCHATGTGAVLRPGTPEEGK